MPAVVYLHGFLSSPKSHKAQVLKQWIDRHAPTLSYHCPHLTPYPSQTQEQLDALLQALQPQPVWLVGSSLGGFWATWLAERYDLPAVLINPSVQPWRFMPEYLGVDLASYHTDDSYRLELEHIAQIQSADCATIKRPQNYWLMVQTGDETLDYRQAVDKYRACRQLIEPEGNHSFVNFEQHLEGIIDFFRAFSAKR